MRIFTTLLAIGIFGLLTAQNTVGLLSYDFSQQYNGFNLIYPHNQPNVYLLNNCGEIVQTWSDNDTFRPGNTAYLLENGNLVKTKRSANVMDDPIWAGGGGATVEIRTWDNELLWSFTLNNENFRLHHDIEPMPNGNIMMIVWEKKTREEALQAGRDPDLLPDDEVWSEMLIEVEPIGEDSFDIVWEWHLWDHLVQDFDASKDNFGVVAEESGKLNINYTTNNGQADWLHANALDYNVFIDQVMLCTPFLSEIYIIDHSTTTEEAAGSTGGMSGLGGDFMFRWGNNEAFDQGTADDKQLFNPHDAHWIDDFIPGSNPDAGKITVYNNQANNDHSAVNIIDPFFDMYEGYAKIGDVFAPADFDWTYVHPDTLLTFSTGLSSVQILPNGNTLICAGRTGYSYELNPEEEIVWEYRTPLIGGAPATQGDQLSINNNLTFRIKRYPKDFDGFEGRDLSPVGFIELEPNTDFCDISLDTDDPADVIATHIFPNPAGEMLTVEWERGGMGYVEVFNIEGRRVHVESVYGGRIYIDVHDWTPGMYIVRVNERNVGKAIISR